MNREQIFSLTLPSFLGPLMPLMQDPEVTDVLVVGHEDVSYERCGKLTRSDIQFSSPHALLALARHIAEYVDRPLDERHPSCDARLPDGSRVHIVIPPVSRSGICISIRRFRESRFTLAELVSVGMLAAQAAEFLSIAVRFKANLLISGGMGAGKSTLLGAAAGAIPASERLIVIEDTSELDFRRSGVVYLEAQPPNRDGVGGISIRGIFYLSLRMRPDRILIGEVRGSEALDLIQTMVAGHPGALATIHGSTPYDALSRLETLCAIHDTAIPLLVVRKQVAAAVNLVVQVVRTLEGLRSVISICECRGLTPAGEYQLTELFCLQAGELVWTGERPLLSDRLKRLGETPSTDLCQELFS